MKDNGIINIHGKEYMTVAKRVELWLADNKNNNDGYSLETEVLNHDPVVIRAVVKWKSKIFTGVSSIDLSSGKMIEKSNPYEVAETSAVGRALGFAGYGIIGGIASADEVQRAVSAQPATPSDGNGFKASEKQIKFIRTLLSRKGHTEKQLMQKYEVTNMEQLTGEQASTIIENLQKLDDVTIH